MNINYFGLDLGAGELKKKLSEDNFVPNFTFTHKLYYNFLRPVIPLSIKQKLQQKYNSRIIFKDNFIDECLIKELGSDKITELKSDGLKIFQYKDGKKCAVVLTHDIEEQHGFNFIPKVIELEKRYGFNSSWNIVPYKYKIDEGIIKLIKDADHEIGIHGYNHDGKLYYSEKIFNKRVPFINDALKKYEAVGFRSPMVHRNLEWLQKLDIQYDASCFDYDPFQPFPGGTSSIWPFIAGKFVELPYTLPQDHTLFYVLKQKDISIWKKKADWVANNKGVILMLTHPDYLINKKHFDLYEEMLKYLQSFENSWYCLPRDLARWWKSLPA